MTKKQKVVFLELIINRYNVWRSEGMIGSITKCKPDTKRPRGHPRQRWVDRVQEYLKLLNVETQKNVQMIEKNGNNMLLLRWALKACKSPKRRRKKTL
jgi:hypothetical protein